VTGSAKAVPVSAVSAVAANNAVSLMVIPPGCRFLGRQAAAVLASNAGGPAW
jgi:hypothetical protein